MTKKTTRAKSAQKSPKAITRSEMPRKSVESYGKEDPNIERKERTRKLPMSKTTSSDNITVIPPLAPGNVFETVVTPNTKSKPHKIHVFEIGRSRFFGNPQGDERLVTFEEDGDMKELKESEFRAYIDDNGFKKQDTRLRRRSKIDLPNGINIGTKYTSEDGKYEAHVVGGNKYIIKVKIKVVGREVESSFYRMYKAEGFSAEKIFSDEIIDYLGTAYLGEEVDRSKDLDFDPTEPCEGFNAPPSDKAKLIPKKTKDTWSTPLDKEIEEGILKIFQTPGEAITQELTQDVLEKIAGKSGFGGTKPMVKTPDIPTEEDLEAFQQAMKEKIKKAHPTPVQTNLFEIVGKTKDETSKDVRFTILGNDIDTELIKKINEHQEVVIYQIKRLSAVDVI